MPSSANYGAGSRNIPMRDKKPAGGAGGGAGAAPRRPMPIGSRFQPGAGRGGGVGGGSRTFPVKTTPPAPAPAQGKGVIAMREPLDLPEEVPDFSNVPPGQLKKSGLPFGWHYDASGEPMRNVGKGPAIGASGFRQPTSGRRMRAARQPMRRRSSDRWQQPFGRAF